MRKVIALPFIILGATIGIIVGLADSAYYNWKARASRYIR